MTGNSVIQQNPVMHSVTRPESRLREPCFNKNLMAREKSTAADFRAVGGQLSLSHDSQLPYWNLFFGVKPQTFLTMLCDGMDVRPEVNIDICADGLCKLDITLYDGEQPILMADRQISFAKKVVFHDGIAAETDAAYRGLGRMLVRNSLHLWQAIGLNTIVMEAGWESGVYLWHKAGFLPDERTWDQLRWLLKDLVMYQSEILQQEAVQTIVKAIYNPDSKAIWDIVDSDITVGGISYAQMVLSGDMMWTNSYLDFRNHDQLARAAQYLGDPTLLQTVFGNTRSAPVYHLDTRYYIEDLFQNGTFGTGNTSGPGARVVRPGMQPS